MLPAARVKAPRRVRAAAKVRHAVRSVASEETRRVARVVAIGLIISGLIVALVLATILFWALSGMSVHG